METEITAIDTASHYAFLKKIKRIIPMPSVIQEEYRRQGRLVEPPKVVPRHQPPFDQYRHAEGYAFSWGHIVERKIERVIAWDFCFDRLLQRYHDHNLGLLELQRVMFDRLSQYLPQLVEADFLYLAAMDAGWRIYPGTAISGFTVVAHFFSEDDARQWVINTLLTDFLPFVMQAAVDHLDHVEDGAQ